MSSLRKATLACIALSFAWTVGACKPKAGALCDVTKTGACADGLVCANPTQAGARCLTLEAATEQCSTTRLCRADGQCTFSPKGFGACVAGSDEDCRESAGCKKDGQCSLADGRCIIATEGDCKQSGVCERKGLCALGVDGHGKATCVLDEATVDGFCAAVDARIDQMLARCDAKPETKDLRGLLQINKSKESCVEHRAYDVVRDKLPACLAELKTWHEAPLAVLERTPACRAAFRGKLALGGACGSDLECPDGAWCTFDAKQAVCATSLAVGAVCTGAECGPSETCDHGRCAERFAARASCDPKKQECAAGLTCLVNKGGAAAGTCGPLRKKGEACHRWTECEGACVTPSPKVEDGSCESFCGSD